VIDPAHGGTDTGARGQNSIQEKDIVLQFARVARAELVRQGYKAVLTRDDDSNPSYDDRAAMANSYHEAIFVSLHISSTGTRGAARTYYYQFWKPLPPASPSQAGSADAATSSASVVLAMPATSPTTLVPWNEAQRSYSDSSQRLADQIQSQMASAFPGSPQTSAGVQVRSLRSVAAPAVGIEISSVAVTDAKSLTVFAGPLATAIAKGVQGYRPLSSTGAK
jgi:N-acetylmuramoyl-L-alanine amidase